MVLRALVWRAPDAQGEAVTRATPKPLRRVVTTMDGEFVAEIRQRTLTLRPLRSRAGGPLEITVTWGAMYVRAMSVQVDRQRAAKRAVRTR